MAQLQSLAGPLATWEAANAEAVHELPEACESLFVGSGPAVQVLNAAAVSAA